MKTNFTELVWLKVVFAFALVWAFLSCNKLNCPTSGGSVNSEVRNLPLFKEIVLNDKINLILTEDSMQAVRVEAGKNFLAGIKTDVVDSVLNIRNGNNCILFMNPNDQINVYVSSNQLSKVTYYGGGNISSTNTIIAPEFTVDSWVGAGSAHLKLMTKQANAIVRKENADITFEGKSDKAYVYNAEAGTVNLINLTSGYVSVVQKSVRDIYVNVTSTLQANLLYIGNVYYKGDPTSIDTLVTSSGKLIHLK